MYIYFLGLWALAIGQVLRIPLQKMEVSPLANRVMSLNPVLGAHPDFSPYVPKVSYAGPHRIRIDDYMNAQYYGTVELGGNQRFSMIFDTGSSNTWVPSVNCGFTTCFTHPRYDPSISPSYKKDGRIFNVTYGSGPVSGVFFEDCLTLGGLCVKNQPMAMVDQLSFGMLGYYMSYFDGILGLGFDAISVNKIPTPVENLVSQGKIDRGVFAFYLEDNLEDPDDIGSLIIGGVEESHFKGELHSAPVIREAYWEVRLDQLSLGGLDILEGESSVILDSGTSLIVGPKRLVDTLAQQLGAYAQVAGLYLIDCDEPLPDIDFFINGKAFGLSPSEYVLSQSVWGYNICFLQIMGIDVPGMNAWILGDVFLRKYYTVFDYDKKQVQLATARKALRL